MNNLKCYRCDSWPCECADGCAVVWGDCRELLAYVDADAVITDPPYGIAGKWKGGFSEKHGWGKAALDVVSRNTWDAKPPSAETINSILAIGSQHIIWGGNYFSLPPSRCWLVWNKPERNFTLAECELAWTDFDNVARVFDCHRSDTGRKHPTQKPVRLLRWCIEKTTGSILDPFAGSGTTLVSAKQLNRKAIGIEIEERYCEIAANRLANEPMPLFREEVAV